MQAFCTIITADHYPRALALFRSIRNYDCSMALYVLVADDKTTPQPPAGLVLLKPADLETYPLVSEVYRKYAHVHMDNFRWSMKPLLTAYLLENGHTKIIYADCDMFFVNDYHFLFEELNHHGMLLVPHWKTTDPLVDQAAFLSMFTSGIYLAGLFAASVHGIPALKWWANACHFMMMPAISSGVHDDQRYLDIMPAIFENTGIIRHRGVGIGAWNEQSSSRSINGDEVLIEGRYPVVVIHFDDMLVRGIMQGHDPHLARYLDQYKLVYEQNGDDLATFLPATRTLAHAGLFPKLKWRMRLRTRIKAWLYKLAQKI